MTFSNEVASGNDSPTTAIIKAMDMPSGTPLATNTWITGTIPEALASRYSKDNCEWNSIPLAMD